jgi:peroxiredoxin (alkyl hydroperoxide reductase subunit C)
VAFSDAASQFKERNAQVVFASVDSEYSLLSWALTARKDGGLGGVSIPLLSDKNHCISKAYGVLLEDEGIALRGLFIIDPKGVIRQVSQVTFFGCVDGCIAKCGGLTLL